MNNSSITDDILLNLRENGGMDVELTKSVVPWIHEYGNLIIRIGCFLLTLAFSVSVVLNIIYILTPTFRNIIDDIVEDDKGFSRKLLAISCKDGKEACRRAYTGGKSAAYDYLNRSRH